MNFPTLPICKAVLINFSVSSIAKPIIPTKAVTAVPSNTNGLVIATAVSILIFLIILAIAILNLPSTKSSGPIIAAYLANCTIFSFCSVVRLLMAVAKFCSLTTILVANGNNILPNCSPSCFIDSCNTLN